MTINQAQLVDLLSEYRRENWRGIQTPEWQDRIVRDTASYDEPAILKRIAPYWELLPEARILDLGSGVGNFVVACRKCGLKAFGIEPDRIGQGSSVTSLQIARQRLDSPAFAAALGEQLPFADATFDLVVLDQVIEHVRDQTRVLAEAFRVLKPGGAMYVACPNYLRFYEPHYKIWFLPLMPKFLGALYLRLRGRDPVLLNQLKYATNWRVRKLLKRARAQLAVDLNVQDFRGKCSRQNSGLASRKARLVQQLTRTPWLSAAVLWAASFCVRLREGGCEMLAIKEA
jgi:SAM-dependent methyltransferase